MWNDQRKVMSTFIEARGIEKAFMGVKALNGVDLDVHVGEVLALVGANGAGKSTLMRILAGAQPPDAGTIAIDGGPVSFGRPQDAQDCGISTVYQELMIVPDLPVVENVFLGALKKNRFGLLDWPAMRVEAGRILSTLGFSASVDALANTLSIAEMQLVEIAKTLTRQSRLVIMDEPTASLAKEEVENLFKIVRRLSAEGIAIIFITHHLNEIFEICDRAVILRDGANAGNATIAELTENELVSMMLGRSVTANVDRSGTALRQDEIVLSARGITRAPALHDIDLTLRRGEVLGIAGLMGAGRTELVRILFGADPADGGTLEAKGRVGYFGSPRAALDAGLGLAPEDRKGEGLILPLSIGQNITLSSLKKHVGPLGLKLGEEASKARDLAAQLQVKHVSLDQAVGELSGGNQQKVVLAKLIGAGVDIYLLDEPTRGIDIGAKEAIFDLIWSLTETGASVILISSDLSELLRLCDTIMCLHLGRVTQTHRRCEFDLNAIMLGVMGKAEHAPAGKSVV